MAREIVRMRTITVNDKIQKNYHYVCSEPAGKRFDPEFKPDLTPKELLELGVRQQETVVQITAFRGASNRALGEGLALWYDGKALKVIKHYGNKTKFCIHEAYDY